MSVNLNVSIPQQTQIAPTEGKQKVQQTFKSKFENFMDIFVTDRGPLEESIVKKLQKPGFKSQKFLYTGTINNKAVSINEISRGYINSENTYSGEIGGKTINFVHKENNLKRLHHATGNYDGKDFELFLNPQFFKSPTITGVIDGKEVTFTFPGSKVPEDETTQDILTTYLMVNGYKPRAKDGEFKSLGMAEWFQRQQAAHAAMQSSTNPTWHYETMHITGAPIFY